MLNKIKHLFTTNKHTTTPQETTNSTMIDGYIPHQTAKQLLAVPNRQQLMQLIWQYTAVTKESFQTLYIDPIERYTALVQQFPASESHHHSYLGGLLDHGLELITHALKMRRSYLLPPGAPPEDQAVQGDAWTAAIAYAGLLHDIGKIAVDIEVQLKDGSLWHPWLGQINQPYRFKYIKGRDYQLHDAATGLLYNQILSPVILNWLCQYPELWGCLLNLLAGRYENTGLLGEIVNKADKVSTANNIGANPEKAMQAPSQSLQKKLLTGLKQLIKNDFKLNTTPGDAWLTQEALWVMSNTTANKLRSSLLSQGFEGIPANNSTLFDELQSYGIIQVNTEGRAIWKAIVSDKSKQWQQEFTLLKLTPALIWSNEQWPLYFDGQILIKETSTVGEQPLIANNENNAIATTGQIEPIDLLQTTTEQSSCSPVLTNQTTATISNTKVFDLNDTNSTANNNGTDDLLALLGDVIATDTVKNTHQQNNVTVVTEIHDNHNQAIFDTDSPIEIATEIETNYTPQTIKQLPSKTELGEYFITWLKNRINSNKIKINEIDAKLHLVNQQLFIVTPGIFQRFCAEHPDIEKQLNQEKNIEAWKQLQRGFEKLKLHQKLANDLNIWQCEVRGPRKKGKIIRGYFIKDTTSFFENIIPDDNPFLTLLNQD